MMMLRPTIWLLTVPFLLVVVFILSHEIDGLSLSPLTQTRRQSRREASWILLEATSQSGIPSWTDGGTVTVRVVEEIAPECSPKEVLEAWMEHHWRRGGGLPIYVDSTPSAEESSMDKEMKRTIYPVAMEERIVSSEDKSNDKDDAAASSEPIAIQYEVSKSGPFFADLVPGSHQGTVTFERDRMTWEVQFETTQLRGLYQTMTEFTVGVAARTVQESCRPARVLKLKAKIPRRHLVTCQSSEAALSKDSLSSPTSTTLIELTREFLEFFWARGGGLPLLPPIPYGDLLHEGGGMARSKLLRIPPAITESIVSITHNDYCDDDDDDDDDDGNGESTEIVYRLEDPGWLTFPFLMHTHLGKVQLISPSTGDDGDDDSFELKWQVEIRSFPFASQVVEALVEMTIGTIARNFLVHLEEPGATIPLMLSEGDTLAPNSVSDLVRSIGIPKASWWGGVIEKLNAKDLGEQDFSALDRLRSAVVPWTWGRTGSGKDDDVIQCSSWIDGKYSQ